MKVVEETPERLLIDHSPWFLRLVLWGMAATFLAVALTGPSDFGDDATGRAVVGALGLGVGLLGWIYAPRVSLLLDSRAGVFEHHETRPFGCGRMHAWPLISVRRARRQSEWSDSARTHRLALETDDGLHPLERGYGPRDRDDIVETINEWLRLNGLYREN